MPTLDLGIDWIPFSDSILFSQTHFAHIHGIAHSNKIRLAILVPLHLENMCHYLGEFYLNIFPTLEYISP